MRDSAHGRYRSLLPLFSFCWLFVPQHVTEAAEPTTAASLLAKDRLIRFEILCGRIRATSFPYSFESRETLKKDKSDEQRLTITVRSGVPTVRYFRNETKRTTKFILTRQGDLHLSVSRTSEAPFHELEYYQSSKGVRVVVRSAKTDRQWSAKDLWELLLSDRQDLQPTLIKELQRIHPAWNLIERLNEVEGRLGTIAGGNWQPVNQRLIERLITDLGDGKFPVRQAAHRKLLALGQPIVPYLAHLDVTLLDREQRSRLTHIRKAIMGKNSDLSDRVALWMSGSRAVWLGMLRRGDLSTRKLAARQLSKILHSRIQFDPSASPDVRLAQLEKLRQRYDARRVAAKPR